MVEKLLAAADGVALLVPVMFVLIEHCCSLSYSSSVGSVGGRFASVSLFPSLVLLGERL